MRLEWVFQLQIKLELNMKRRLKMLEAQLL
jgi:hypothetical protein